MEEETKVEETPNAEEQDHSAVFEDGIETEETEEVKTTEDANEGVISVKEENSVAEATKQDKIDYAFRKKQFELKEANEARAKLEQEKAELKAALEKQSVSTRPKIPDVPDSFDPEFEQKMAIRDSAIIAQQEYDQKIKAQEAQLLQQQQALVQRRKEEIKQNTEKFINRTEELGIDRDELAKAEQYVSTFATPANVPTIEYIQKHKDGPLIVQYLAQDHQVLDKVSKMHPMDAAEFIATEIAPKAAGLKPKTPSAPPPVQTFDSKGAAPPSPKALEGAVFE